ncbi:hypothetical protein BT96DRAFT_980807 [Gymnopus androsaceus JB14]|uniref:Uncharacterized protein n=1 Tax=Gymnopus androsaceus JB14 TaxID=1447944 RepID=A0A6A4GTP0_9AGAR|nr:hypothetical protein BT96DRAFT_980807 [Gymnopus androsaceus JB14]
MTPAESEQIAHAGITFFQNISTMIFILGLFGIYTLAFIISMHIISQKENNGWAHKALIVLFLAGFGVSALVTCANITTNLFLVKFALVVPLPGGLIAQGIAANSKVIATEILEVWSENFIFLIADAAIVWRALALWAENGLIKWTVLIILLVDIGVNISDAIVDTKGAINLINNAVALDWASIALGLTVNIVATLLIAYRAWMHHQSTHAILHHKKTKVESILSLMVESGAIFGVVQVINIVFNLLDSHAADLSPVDNASAFVDALNIYSAALNPVALIILIQTGNTYEHSFHLEDVPSLEMDSGPNLS